MKASDIHVETLEPGLAGVSLPALICRFRSIANECPSSRVAFGVDRRLARRQHDLAGDGHRHLVGVQVARDGQAPRCKTIQRRSSS